MKNLSQKFGERLHQIRIKKGLTQAQLAEMIDVSVDFVGLMERGINAPSFKTLEKLSKVLNMPVSDFFVFHKEDLKK